MFTGIIQAKGEIASRLGSRLVVKSPNAWPSDPWVIGESVSVNGVCLTVIDSADGLLFDVSEETLEKSTLGGFASGDLVNLERAMRPVDRYGGHFVQGHVDQTGTVTMVEELESSWEIGFSVGIGMAKYLIPKGSICIDGVSLTIVDPHQGEFKVALIPHTWNSTTLSKLTPGKSVNVEFDVLTKTVEALLNATR